VGSSRYTAWPVVRVQHDERVAPEAISAMLSLASLRIHELWRVAQGNADPTASVWAHHNATELLQRPPATTRSGRCPRARHRTDGRSSPSPLPASKTHNDALGFQRFKLVVEKRPRVTNPIQPKRTTPVPWLGTASLPLSKLPWATPSQMRALPWTTPRARFKLSRYSTFKLAGKDLHLRRTTFLACRKQP